MRSLLEARVSELLHAVADATPVAPGVAPGPTPAAAPARPAPRLEPADRSAVLELVPARGDSGAEELRRTPSEADGRTAPRPRGRRVLVGAAAAVLVGAALAGIAAVEHGPAPIAAPRAVAVDPSSVPKVVLDGWATASYQETPLGNDAGLRWTLVLRDPSKGLAGPVVRVGAARPPFGYGVGDGGEPVAIGTVTGSMASRGSEVAVVWEPAPDRTVFVAASGMPAEAVLAIARGVRLDADQVPIAAGAVPAPLVATPLPPLPATGTYGEYHFRRGDQDLQLSFYVGGTSMFELRSADDGRRAVPVLGSIGLLLDYGDGRYRVDVLLGPWTWEADGSGYASAEQFLSVVNRITVVDDAAWTASVAGATTNPVEPTSGSAPAVTAAGTASTLAGPPKG